MKKRIISTIAALTVFASLMTTASAEDVTYEVLGETHIVSDIIESDGYESFSHTTINRNGAGMRYEYFFPTGEEAEYYTATYIFPEGWVIEDFADYVGFYSIEDFTVLSENEYLLNEKLYANILPGTIEEVRNAYLPTGDDTTEDNDDETIGDYTDDETIGDYTDDETIGDYTDDSEEPVEDDTELEEPVADEDDAGAVDEGSDPVIDDSEAEDVPTEDTPVEDSNNSEGAVDDNQSAGNSDVTSSEKNPHTGVAGVASTAAVAIVATGIALLSKKRR